MKGKKFWIFIILVGSFAIFSHFPSHAQEPTRTLTVLYSNNLNGEIDACPT